MAVRILLVLATLAVFYGCDQPGSPPEQGERDGGVEQKGATSLGPSRQETTRQDVADMKIAFGVRRPGGGYDYDYDYDLYVMNADGSNLARLADGADPAWSPDGTEIAFTDTKAVYKMDADGSGVTPLAPSQHVKKPEAASGGWDVTDMKNSPVWSPDGEQVAYVRVVPYCAPDGPCSSSYYTLYSREIYVVNSDGTNAKLVRKLRKEQDIWGLDW